MRQELTLGGTEALASAVEAIGLYKDITDLAALRQLRSYKKFAPNKEDSLGSRHHADTWEFRFDCDGIFEITVTVELLCQACRQPFGHKWTYRTIMLCEKEDTRPGECHATYEGAVAEPLHRTNLECWSA